MDFPPNYSDAVSNNTVRLPSYNNNNNSNQHASQLGQIKRDIATSLDANLKRKSNLITIILDENSCTNLKDRHNIFTWNYQGSDLSGKVEFTPASSIKVGRFSVQLVLYEVVHYDCSSPFLARAGPYSTVHKRYVVDEFNVDEHSFPENDLFQGAYSFDFQLQFPHVLPDCTNGGACAAILRLPIHGIPPPSLGSPHIFDELSREDIKDRSIRLAYRLEVKAYNSKKPEPAETPICSAIKSLFYAPKYTADEVQRYVARKNSYSCQTKLMDGSKLFSKSCVVGDIEVTVPALPWLGVGLAADKVENAHLTFVYKDTSGASRQSKPFTPEIKSIDVKLASHYITSDRHIDEIPDPEEVKKYSSNSHLKICTQQTSLQQLEGVNLYWEPSVDPDSGNMSHRAELDLPIVVPKNTTPSFFFNLSSCQHEIVIHVKFVGRSSMELKIPVVVERVG